MDCKAQGNTRLLYSVYDADADNWSVTPVCPAGILPYPQSQPKDSNCIPEANCLASFMNPPSAGAFAGYSGLLVGGTQITSYTNSEYVRKDRTGTPVSGDLLRAGLNDIHVAQTGTDLTVWFTNTKDAAGYYQVNSSASFNDGRMVNLLSEGKGGRLSGMITAVDVDGGSAFVNIIISVDETGNLTSLQQSAAAGSWDAYPLLMSTKVSNFEIPSYTTRLRVMSGASKPAGSATFVLKSSGRVSAIINGSETYLTEGGLTLRTDESGEATFIVATADVSSHTFEISNVMDLTGKDLAIGTVNVDPSQRAFDRLKGITDGPSLERATTPQGKPLIDTSELHKDDIENAGKIIGQLQDHAGTLRANPARKKKIMRARLALHSREPTAPEWWTWVTGKVHEAENWAFEKLGKYIHIAWQVCEG